MHDTAPWSVVRPSVRARERLAEFAPSSDPQERDRQGRGGPGTLGGTAEASSGDVQGQGWRAERGAGQGLQRLRTPGKRWGGRGRTGSDKKLPAVSTVTGGDLSGLSRPGTES